MGKAHTNLRNGRGSLNNNMKGSLPSTQGESPTSSSKKSFTVGIIGGGIAGLYTALLLKSRGIPFHIFEGTNRVGGRVFTHYFTPDKDQYFEAGAMRIPESDFQTIFFDLVGFVNQRFQARGGGEGRGGEDRSGRQIELIDYVLSTKGNEVYVNGVRPDVQAFEDGAGEVTPRMVKWDVPEEYQDITANDLMQKAIGPFLRLLAAAEKTGQFEQAFRSEIVAKYDNYSFRYYLNAKVEGKDWTYPTSVIDFLETVTSQTNQFALSVPELIMQSLDFGTARWLTIDGGMSRLPEAMAHLIGLSNITFGARVASLSRTYANDDNDDDGSRVTITATGANGELSATFDKVVLAIPPAALKMLVSRPRWSPEKEMAIRSIHFEALYKMGLRFKTRFWEKVQGHGGKARGGQSTTDLPIRWVVFPSNGIGSEGEGVLLVYAWMTDARTWLPLSPTERRNLALHNLEELYHGRLGEQDGRPITVADLLIETYDAAWSESTATGDAMFLPGQFQSRFDVARQPEDDTFYFAGEHISFHHTWIAGAAESALWTVRQMLGDQDIQQLSLSTEIVERHHSTANSGIASPSQSALRSRDEQVSLARVLPTDLGDARLHALGAQCNHLRGRM